MFQSRGPTCRKRPRSGAKSDSSSVLTTKARNVQDDGRSEDKRGKVGSPLKGAVVCLTGLSPCEKDHYHNLIEKLGGSYTRDLNANNNTHLVCRQAEGAKYDLASSFPKQISIVTPTWLDECHAKLVRADERQHSLTPPNESAPQKHVDIKDGVPCNKMGDDGSLLSHVERLLAKSKRTKSILFSACHFHLVGFDDDQRFGKSGKQNKNFTQDECGERFVLLLGRLIRRGLGTIHYDFHDGITHVLVNDHAGEHLRDAATAINRHFPNGPVFISPRWVLHSWEQTSLLGPADFVPIYSPKPTLKPSVGAKPTAGMNLRAASSSLFKGRVFALLRVTPPPGTVDFDSKEVEKSIRIHGGQVLSLKLLDALKADSTGKGLKRKCFAIVWGGFTPANLEMHPLLAQCKRLGLCDLQLATPIWLQTCIAENRVVSPSSVPQVFVPSSKPLRLLSHQRRSVGKKDQKKDPWCERNIRISISGFRGHLRTALRLLIEAMGAIFDDSMRNVTTHLVCQEAKGQKYEKAQLWNLHIVSVDWLYHVAEYGYSGLRPDAKNRDGSIPSDSKKSTAGGKSESASIDPGCESEFPV